MKNTYTITEAQARLPRLVREVAHQDPVAVTRHGETVAYLVSRERMEAVLETIEILSNEGAMKQIRRYQAGLITFKKLDGPNE